MENQLIIFEHNMENQFAYQIQRSSIHKDQQPINIFFHIKETVKKTINIYTYHPIRILDKAAQCKHIIALGAFTSS